MFCSQALIWFQLGMLWDANIPKVLAEFPPFRPLTKSWCLDAGKKKSSDETRTSFLPQD